MMDEPVTHWRNRDGDKVLITGMSDRYLINMLSMVERDMSGKIRVSFAEAWNASRGTGLIDSFMGMVGAAVFQRVSLRHCAHTINPKPVRRLPVGVVREPRIHRGEKEHGYAE